MQLTRFDRWLKSKFVFETHIYTMRQLAEAPKSVVLLKLPETQGQRFRFKYIARSEKAVDEIVDRLNSENMMFNTRVVDRKGWYVPIIAPDGKSFTWRVVSTVLISFTIAGVAYLGMWLWSNPEIRKMILDSIDTLRG